MSNQVGPNGSNGVEEAINTNIVTLTRFLTEEQVKVKEATGDFTLLCHALQFSFKSIAYYIRRATLINLTGLAGSSNTTGDEQKKLDVISNDLFIAAMRSSGKCALLVSEEEEEIIFFNKEHTGARYAVACDPIDGSSNLDAGVSVGTIFAIHKLAEGSTGTKEDILKPGTELVAAGFTMYGASAQLVITMKGGGVQGFTLDNGVGEFILTHPNMRLPKQRAIYSVNEGNSLYWEDNVKAYFESLKQPQGEDGKGKPYSARYIGSMVADAYRTLLYGGVFAYPADKKSPKGKLRILYECAPMAMVFENAGGQALNSKMERMLDVVPEHIHDRSGIFMGSWDEMEKVKKFHK
ncbi:Fructose-1,6-bisphosphatase [Gnomoniopsis smithogilvyi]|uniref:Fructose-1,6-bisphosphatase n=1 Tax=Gnomoniopsis smithogilvyi TaxID=1191159 RepID=A0A9W8YZX1_9PEZI|nr:Fructose-1,6-bisphosphatase [Gnomoniopsis smithogilvyi]